MFIKFALDLIFPPKCGICKKDNDEYICNKCLEEIKKYYVRESILDNEIISVFEYRDYIKRLIIDYKFNDKSYLYKTFSNIILKNEMICEQIKKYDIMVPVPVHIRRFLERGYNQSELISNEISKKLKIEHENKALIKIKNISPQSKKGKKERFENIKDVFKVSDEKLVKNKKILIFDDIYTTGSTYMECKRVLLNSGATKVGILTLAKD